MSHDGATHQHECIQLSTDHAGGILVVEVHIDARVAASGTIQLVELQRVRACWWGGG